MSNPKVREPLMHIVKRDPMPFWKSMLIRLIAVVLALVVCGGVIVLLTSMIPGKTALNPLQVYAGIWDGAMGTNRRMWVTFRDAAVLLCVGLAILPAFRMRFWNIGAEGQVLMGALGTAAVMIYGKGLPPVLLYTLMALAGILLGAIWGIIPAFFKARWNTNETLFTLMMNYVATQVVTFCIIFWENPKGSNKVGSLDKAVWLPNIAGNKYLLTISLVLFIAVALYFYMRYTKQGYEIAVVGESENTARYSGINVSKVIMRTMALSGAIAGVCGFLLAGDVGHTISTGLAGGRGFTAITVAWLGKLNPFAMIVVAFFLVFMERGSSQIATDFNLSESASEILTGIILFFILGCEFFINYRLEFRSRKHTEEVVKA
ncbi:MAG: ABC transporter permease [Clostridiales bacterium]|nr:ABC transporter permease [Clostridiales bacterium]